MASKFLRFLNATLSGVRPELSMKAPNRIEMSSTGFLPACFIHAVRLPPKWRVRFADAAAYSIAERTLSSLKSSGFPPRSFAAFIAPSTVTSPHCLSDGGRFSCTTPDAGSEKHAWFTTSTELRKFLTMRIPFADFAATVAASSVSVILLPWNTALA